MIVLSDSYYLVLHATVVTYRTVTMACVDRVINILGVAGDSKKRSKVCETDHCDVYF